MTLLGQLRCQPQTPNPSRCCAPLTWLKILDTSYAIARGSGVHTEKAELAAPPTSWSSCTDERKLTRDAKPSGKM